MPHTPEDVLELCHKINPARYNKLIQPQALNGRNQEWIKQWKDVKLQIDTDCATAERLAKTKSNPEGINLDAAYAYIEDKLPDIGPEEVLGGRRRRKTRKMRKMRKTRRVRRSKKMYR
jgi:hypothetical protein